MATNVSNLEAAMEAAGYDSAKALAEASGVSYGGVRAILKRGTCNPSTAEKLQEACGEHRIGPLVQAERAGGTTWERCEATLKEQYPDIRPDFRAWFFEEIGDRVLVIGTRKSPESGLMQWGTTLYDPDGTRVAEDFGYDSYVTAGDAGRVDAQERAQEEGGER